MSKIKDPKLAKKGQLEIEWAESNMPVLMEIRKRFQKEKPFKNLKISACLHVTKETAVLVQTLKEGGAKIALCGSNPLSTKDEIAAALVKKGIEVFAWRGLNQKEYYFCIEKVLAQKPNITLDDGGDLVSFVHSKKQELIKNIIGGTEETTTGVLRFKAMEKEGALKYPIVAVNDAYSKFLFDNRYGTGQSTIDGILRGSSILLAGKTFVVCGYGFCGKGVALRAKGMGAKVIIVEVDPIKALEALMDGFEVMPSERAAKVGDIFVTVTGNKNVISKKHFLKMKSGAILANAGHFNVEINLNDLESLTKEKRKIRENLEEYILKNGKKLYLLAEGRLVNLAAAEGHPSEVMDMSFSLQALSCRWLTKNKNLAPKVYKVPEEIDKEVAFLKLKSMGIKIDKLTREQKRYLESWKEGT
jgi:adenosylhomocysteinase